MSYNVICQINDTSVGNHYPRRISWLEPLTWTADTLFSHVEELFLSDTLAFVLVDQFCDTIRGSTHASDARPDEAASLWLRELWRVPVLPSPVGGHSQLQRSATKDVSESARTWQCPHLLPDADTGIGRFGEISRVIRDSRGNYMRA